VGERYEGTATNAQGTAEFVSQEIGELNAWQIVKISKNLTFISEEGLVPSASCSLGRNREDCKKRHPRSGISPCREGPQVTLLKNNCPLLLNLANFKIILSDMYDFT
jgi:hypothetical protein